MLTPVELATFARLILESSRLEDKLYSPEILTDDQPHSERWTRDCPARPSRLQLDDPRPRPPPPRLNTLHKPEARGRALHAFANHELMAAELMALCLLKFPDAPPGFRSGVAQTLIEEQGHLRRYLHRMTTLGVAFGDLPVSGFFWRALAPMQSPMDYVTGMSLVFEQANLDFAAQWARNFEASEDTESAKLMWDVLEDEIGHVKHGVVWFNRWRPSGSSFRAFVDSLPSGIDAIRARSSSGPMEVEPRLRAGLSQAFIDHLRAHRGSRGRRPQLWVFSPEIEEHVMGHTRPSNLLQKLTADLTRAFGFLGANEDLVLGVKSPTTPPDLDTWTESWSSAGLATPKIVGDVSELQGVAIDEVIPWGWSTELHRRLKPLTGNLRVALGTEAPPQSQLSKATVGPLRARAHAEGWLASEHLGQLMTDVSQVHEHLHKHPHTPIVIKALYSASGRHRRVVETLLSGADTRWVQQQCERAGGVWVENWLSKQADFSLVVSREKPSPTLLRLLNREDGSYRGHLLGALGLGLSQTLATTLYRFQGGLKKFTRSVATMVNEELGLTTFGVDMLIEQPVDGPPRLHPLVELNARYTMGHIARELQARICPGSVGAFLLIHRSDLDRVHMKAFSSLTHVWPTARTEAAGTRHRRIAHGVLPLTPPTQAQVVLPIMVVGSHLQELEQLLHPLDISLSGVSA